ncbi:MAG: hypothetical protein WAP35_02595 [Solirubrobacterales bacterium]
MPISVDRSSDKSLVTPGVAMLAVPLALAAIVVAFLRNAQAVAPAQMSAQLNAQMNAQIEALGGGLYFDTSFDTSGRSKTGSRWQNGPKSGGGYAVRHAGGL